MEVLKNWKKRCGRLTAGLMASERHQTRSRKHPRTHSTAQKQHGGSRSRRLRTQRQQRSEKEAQPSSEPGRGAERRIRTTWAGALGSSLPPPLLPSNTEVTVRDGGKLKRTPDGDLLRRNLTWAQTQKFAGLFRALTRLTLHSDALAAAEAAALSALWSEVSGPGAGPLGYISP